MLEQTSGRGERRATLIVFCILLAEALWVFFHKYLPLDAGLWAMQADLVREHMSGNSSGLWKLIPYPAANVGVPYLAGVLSFFMSPEVATRLLMAFGAILVRGMGAVMLCRVMRVRDESIYYLIPVFIFGTTWFSGALPYLIGEAIAFWIIALFLAQSHPRKNAYWVIAGGLAITALCHALAFLFAALVVITIALEQRRSVHLSQGWLSSGKTVMSTLVPGLFVLLLSLIAQEPIFRITTSALLPENAWGFLLFLGTPAPDVLEATFKGGDILHAILAAGLMTIVLGCFARAFFLAIEEFTWQSRALKSAGRWLIVLALIGVFLRPIGFDLPVWISAAALVTLISSYSGGPAVRRTIFDRILLVSSIVAVATTGILNGLSINRGSEAAVDAYRITATLLNEQALASPASSTRFVIDSSFVQSTYDGKLVGRINYSATVPIYLLASRENGSMLMQPRGGAMRPAVDFGITSSPARILEYKTPEQYVDPRNHVIAVLPEAEQFSSTFGRWEFSLNDSTHSIFERGESRYKISVGSLEPNESKGMAIK